MSRRFGIAIDILEEYTFYDLRVYVEDVNAREPVLTIECKDYQNIDATAHPEFRQYQGPLYGPIPQFIIESNSVPYELHVHEMPFNLPMIRTDRAFWVPTLAPVKLDLIGMMVTSLQRFVEANCPIPGAG